MIHNIWISSVLYRILKYFIFFRYYYCYNIYAIILISLHRTSGPSSCLCFDIWNIFFVHKTSKTATIHGCCLIILHTLPNIRADVASSWSTYTKVSALHWYLVYWIDIIVRAIQGDCFLYSYTSLKGLCVIVQF